MRLALAACTALVLTACGSTSTPTDPGPGSQVATAGIYVTTAANTVLVFPLTATGNAAPARTLAGAATGLALPIGIAVDSHGSIYVANRKGSAVTVYPLGADGNVAPTRSMTDTAMKSPQGLFIDSGDGVFVTTCPNCGSAAGGATGMYHFPNGANAIDYFLRGANTGMTVPVGVSVDASRNVYIGNAFGGTMNVYAPGASGNSLPIRSFNPGAGQNIQSQFVTANTILLASPGSGILSYINTAVAGTPPSTTLPSSSTLPITYPGGMFLDTSVPQPVLYLVDYGANAIRIVQTTGTAPNLGVASVATITGAATGLAQPLGITVKH
jgi:hypothetical protein